MGIAKRIISVLPPYIQRCLRTARDTWKLRRFTPYETTRRFGTRNLRVKIADPTAAAWYDRDWEIPGEILFLKDCGYLTNGATIFDIGCHQCIVAMILADFAGPEGKVIAVEPSRHNLDIADINIKNNGFKNITTIHAAAASKAGRVSIDSLCNAHVSTRTRGWSSIESTTIDKLYGLFGAPDTLFVDVEGYEIDVLRGARKTIAECKPAIYVEVHAGGHGLEKHGTVAELLSCIPESYAKYVSEVERVRFVPLQTAQDALQKRSFLVAIPKRGP